MLIEEVEAVQDWIVTLRGRLPLGPCAEHAQRLDDHALLRCLRGLVRPHLLVRLVPQPGELAVVVFRRAVAGAPLLHFIDGQLLGWRELDSGEVCESRALGFLLMNALHRVLLASHTLAVHAMIVDARDDAAAAFYRKYGFIPFADDARQLLLPMATLHQLLAS